MKLLLLYVKLVEYWLFHVQLKYIHKKLSEYQPINSSI